MKAITRLRGVLAALLGLAVISALPTVAGAQPSEERQGARLLEEVQRGESRCSDLGRADLTAVGEFVMGRMLGSPRAHEAMDRMMAAMMGKGGLDRMHEVMGVRFTGCGDPDIPGGFGGMMGGMGMMGGSGPGRGMMGPGSGMMGAGAGYGSEGAADGSGFRGSGYGPGSMMGFANASSAGDDDDNDVGIWMGIAMLVLLAIAGAAIVIVARGGRRPPAEQPRELLAQRFARGEISAKEYSERRRLLSEGVR